VRVGSTPGEATLTVEVENGNARGGPGRDADQRRTRTLEEPGSHSWIARRCLEAGGDGWSFVDTTREHGEASKREIGSRLMQSALARTTSPAGVRVSVRPLARYDGGTAANRLPFRVE
jgi:hypothetical protein